MKPWECPRCKTIHAAWVGSCTCRPEESPQQPLCDQSKQIGQKVEMITCSCGASVIPPEHHIGFKCNFCGRSYIYGPGGWVFLFR